MERNTLEDAEMKVNGGERSNMLPILTFFKERMSIVLGLLQAVKTST